jgi:glycosyltransferase involved in cell wall biosynthesis
MISLRLLVVAPQPGMIGGVSTFANTLCAYMGERHKVVRAAVGQDQSSLPLPLRLLRDGWRLMRQIRGLRPDVVLLNPSFDNAILRDAFYLQLIRLVHRGVIVVFNHGWGTSYPERVGRSPFLRFLGRLLFGHVERIYVLGQARREILLAWRFDAGQVVATTTMYDHRQFDGLARLRRTTSERQSIRLLFLSRMAIGKGASELVQVLARLAQAHPEVELECAGDGEDRPRAEQLAAELGVTDRVSFRGFVSGEAKAQSLLDADLFVLPTRLNEGLPVSLLEAMGAGLPIIASGQGGIVDLFDQGAQGSMMSATPEIEEIEVCLRGWIADPTRSRMAGEANRALAMQKFSASAWCDALGEDFLSLVAARGACAGKAAAKR